MAKTTNTKKNYAKGFYTVIGYLGIIGIPALIGFGFLLDDFVEGLKYSLPEIFSSIMMWVSIITCAYCLLRTYLGVVHNVFLPKIPTPKNLVLKLLVLATLGTLIGIFSPVWMLILWVVTCLIGMATYSFV